jgi:predicted component of type VI protein secretion system
MMQTSMMKRLRIAGLLCLLLSGCATVAPYERERLASRDMELEGNPDMNAGKQHATAYREGSSGAEGASGGGCGCN